MALARLASWTNVLGCTREPKGIVKQADGHDNVVLWNSSGPDRRQVTQVPNRQEVGVHAIEGAFVKVRWHAQDGWMNKRNVVPKDECPCMPARSPPVEARSRSPRHQMRFAIGSKVIAKPDEGKTKIKLTDEWTRLVALVPRDDPAQVPRVKDMEVIQNARWKVKVLWEDADGFNVEGWAESYNLEHKAFPDGSTVVAKQADGQAAVILKDNAEQIVGMVPNGEKVQVLDSRDGKTKVRFKEFEGWGKVYNFEAEQSLTLNFSPGKLGLHISDDGIVMVVNQGRAQEQGVKVGMRMTRIGGQQFSKTLLQAQISGTQNYEVEFIDEAEAESPVTILPRDILRWKWGDLDVVQDMNPLRRGSSKPPEDTFLEMARLTGTDAQRPVAMEINRDGAALKINSDRRSDTWFRFGNVAQVMRALSLEAFKLMTDLKAKQFVEVKFKALEHGVRQEELDGMNASVHKDAVIRVILKKKAFWASPAAPEVMATACQELVVRSAPDDGQYVTSVPQGEKLVILRREDEHVRIRWNRTEGWVESRELSPDVLAPTDPGLVAPQQRGGPPAAQSDTRKVLIIGTGVMGSRVAAWLLVLGERVHIWTTTNRTLTSVEAACESARKEVETALESESGRDVSAALAASMVCGGDSDLLAALPFDRNGSHLKVKQHLWSRLTIDANDGRPGYEDRRSASNVWLALDCTREPGSSPSEQSEAAQRCARLFAKVHGEAPGAVLAIKHEGMNPSFVQRQCNPELPIIRLCFLRPVFFVPFVELLGSDENSVSRVSRWLQKYNLMPFSSAGRVRMMQGSDLDDVALRLMRRYALQQYKGEVPEADVCCVCLSEPAQVVNGTCGHSVFCEGCAADYSRAGQRKCPLCRAPWREDMALHVGGAGLVQELPVGGGGPPQEVHFGGGRLPAPRIRDERPAPRIRDERWGAPLDWGGGEGGGVMPEDYPLHQRDM